MSLPTSSTPVGVREPDEPIDVRVTRAQAWDIYDLLVARGRQLEANEDIGLCNLGSSRYLKAADELRKELA